MKIRGGEAKEDAKLSEFQQELLQLAGVLHGEDIEGNDFEKIKKEMTVKEGDAYMESSLRRFLRAGLNAKRMGLDGDQIIITTPSPL